MGTVRITFMALIAVASLALTLPRAGSARFVVAGAPCTHDGRGDGTCPSIGSIPCLLTYKVCNAGNAPFSSICTDGGGTDACGGDNNLICGDKNHASDDPQCGGGG
jgi:hypothetical protein